jgi:hypothetical protein
VIPIWPAMKAMLTAAPADEPLPDGSATLPAALGAGALGAAALGAVVPLLQAATRTIVAAPSARYRPNPVRFTLLLLHASPMARKR